MSTADHQRLVEVFGDALLLPEDQRAQLLEDACRNEEERTLVEALLRADAANAKQEPVEEGRAGQMVLDLLKSIPAPASVVDGALGLAFAQEGNYTIHRELGRGGMGVVYLARQERTGQLVALKCLRLSSSTKKVVQRFEREAEAMGRVDHPGIAQVYDAGTIQVEGQDQHYFVMEYVRGRTLVDYARTHEVGLREQLTLLAAVCEAVQHAHEQGVIHRDLKPTNILVNDRGEPKILDFGVSRMVDKEMQLTTVGTDMGQMIGTLSYMSPEQAGGDQRAVGELSDVYALGVIAYELLSGRLPHDLSEETILSAARVIREERPARVTAVVPGIPSDVATIIEKALDLDADRRYSSCRAMAQDLQRFLRNEPILARPASTVYLIRKFARRHRLLVGISSVALLALLAAIVASIYLHLSQARSAADLRAEKDRTEFESYVANVAAAGAAIQVNDVREARLRLDSAPPDLRSWEWDRLDALTDQSVWTFRGHAEWTSCARFSPDGKLIVTGSMDGTACILDARDGTLLRRLSGDTAEIHEVRFLDDGEHVLTARANGAIQLWRVRDGSRVMDFAGHDMAVDSLAIFPDGKRFLSASIDATLRVWDLSSGKELRRYEQEGLGFLGVALTPDGRRAATAGQAGSVKLWDLESGSSVLVCDDFTAKVESIAFGDEGRTLAANANVLRIWDVGSLKQLAVWNPREAMGATRPTFAADSSWMAVAGNDRTVRCWNWRTNELLGTQRGHRDPITSIEISPDGSRMVTACFDGEVKLWDAANAGDPRVFKGHDAYVQSAAFGPRGELVASIDRRRWLRVWDARSGEALAAYQVSGDGMDLAFSGVGKELVTACREGVVSLFDLDTGMPRWTLSLPEPEWIHAIAIDPTHTWVATGSAESRFVGAHLISLASGEEITRFEGAGVVHDVAFHPTKPLLATAGDDGQISIWELPSGRLRVKLTGHEGAIHGLAYDPSGHTLASASLDHTVRLWNEEGECMAVLEGHSRGVESVAFHPGGDRLASGSQDRSIIIWDLETRREVERLVGHNWWVFSVEFSPDGKTLVSASKDRSVRLWGSD